MRDVRDIPMTGAQTTARVRRLGGGTVFVEMHGAGSGGTPHTATTTRPAQGLFSRFGSYMLPLAIAAALSSPAPVGEIRRRTYVRPGTAHFDFSDAFWTADDWAYTTEPADYEQVMILKDLLSLTTAEGLVLDIAE